MLSDAYFVKLIYKLFGSWYSVLGHTILFITLLFIHPDMLFFTTFVSIEAIYIGIFILMAANREEALKEKREARERNENRKYLQQDVDITQQVMSEVDQIKHDLNAILSKYNNK